MNTKIFNIVDKNLREAFKLPKYQAILDSLSLDTVIEDLPWTPARLRKFKETVQSKVGVKKEFSGTIKHAVEQLDIAYNNMFFGEMWKPRTDIYSYTGWAIAEEITKLKPEAVLDVGCGYNQFKGRIPNLVGIDPYNNCADYQIDILEYKVKPKSYDVIIALGSLNFNGREWLEPRFEHCVNLLKPGGKFYLRANPGVPHEDHPGNLVDLFPWTFEVVNEFAEKYNLHLDTFKQDANHRLYFVYTKQ